MAPSAPSPRGTTTGKTIAQAKNTCPCNSSVSSGRNLVVCIDGTSNQFGMKNTNVVELYSRLIKNNKQCTLYNSGIGTYAKPTWKSLSYIEQVVANKLDLAFALRFEKIIISAYAWLVDNYQDGDLIFMFGFSRGAYQVRALAAMLQTVGLLHKGNQDQIPFAFELYAASDPANLQLPSRSTPDETESPTESGTAFEPSKDGTHLATGRTHTSPTMPPSLAETVWGIFLRSLCAIIWQLIRYLLCFGPEDPTPAFPRPPQRQSRLTGSDSEPIQTRFKATFSRDITAHFVGVWDTVSSVGFARDKTLPGTTDGMKNVCFFRHALALHEYRVKFLPEYVNGGAGPEESPLDSDAPPHTKEVWFTGSHSDIGGGNMVNTTLDKFGPALRWMSFEAVVCGLRIKEGPQLWEPSRISDSMTLIWKLVELLPIKRLTYDNRQPAVTSWPPHLFSQRRVQPNQLVHETVFKECGTEDLGLGFIVKREMDAYTSAQALLILPDVDNETSIKAWATRLHALLGSHSGRQSLVDLKNQISNSFHGIEKLIRRHPDPMQVKQDIRLLQDILLFGPSRTTQELQPLGKILGIQKDESDETRPFVLQLEGHTDIVQSLTFLSPKLLLSGSWDHSIRIWDIDAGGPAGDALPGHFCAAVSPDGLIASGASDGSIRTWKFESGQFVATGLVIHGTEGCLYSVAFSPDGLKIASTSSKLHMWDARTGETLGIGLGHSDMVSSAAFSPDGACIVSGSADCTVRLWDATTLQPLGAPLTGHANRVMSVTFSPDGASIASAGFDTTVRIHRVEPVEYRRRYSA